MQDPSPASNVVVKGDVDVVKSSVMQHMQACFESGLEGDVAMTSSDGRTFMPHRFVLAVSPLLARIFNQVSLFNEPYVLQLQFIT